MVEVGERITMCFLTINRYIGEFCDSNTGDCEYGVCNSKTNQCEFVLEGELAVSSFIIILFCSN